MELSPRQITAGLATGTCTGVVNTVTVVTAVWVQPCTLVPLTVYVVFADGLTIIDVVVLPVLQENVETPTPEAVSVFEVPLHIVGLDTLIGDTVGEA